jgi:5S rRNA maturation endonuclease (ribonuclease M5)
MDIDTKSFRSISKKKIILSELGEELLNIIRDDLRKKVFAMIESDFSGTASSKQIKKYISHNISFIDDSIYLAIQDYMKHDDVYGIQRISTEELRKYVYPNIDDIIDFI